MLRSGKVAESAARWLPSRRRILAWAAFAILVLACVAIGRSLVVRIDVGRHVGSAGFGDAAWYPFVLLGIKAGLALLLARLGWRFLRAHAVAEAARSLIAAAGGRPGPVPRLSLRLSAGLWASVFAAASTIHLVLSHAAGDALFAPWLHTSALPVYAVLAVGVAALWGAVSGWLAAYEDYAAATADLARRLGSGHPLLPAARPRPVAALPPLRLFGSAFASRPPPQAA
jgi:hypothetical protein